MEEQQNKEIKGREEEKKSLPDKLYYSIGEVSEYFGIKQSILRYWEKEFSNLSPRKTLGKHRLYKKEDIEFIGKVKELLDNGMSVQVSKVYLKQRKKEEQIKRRLAEVKGEVTELLKRIEGMANGT